MFNPYRLRHGVLAVFVLAILALLSACDDAGQQNLQQIQAVTTTAAEASTAHTLNHSLEVYKSPTCGCCGAWIEHMEQQDFAVSTHHPQDLEAIKQTHGIQPRYRSCHTAVSAEGYVFEGHIPAPLIQQFLASPPEGAIGLAVPGMPLGSPGMEMGDRFMPYQVLLLKNDGSSEVYADIQSAQQQVATP